MALTGGGLGFSYLNFPAWDVIRSLAPTHLFYALSYLQVSILEVDVAVEEAKQFTCA